MSQVIAPDLVRGAADSLRLRIAAGDEYVLGFSELRRACVRVVAPRIVPVPRPHFPVLRVELAGLRGARVEHGVVAVASRELDRVLVAAREPQRGIRPLARVEVELEVPVGEVFPLVIEDRAPAGGKKNLERLAVALARLFDVPHEKIRGLDRRDTAPHAELQAPVAHVIEHADLVVEAKRVVPGQAEREGTQPQPLRPLDRRGEHERGRAVDRERRALVLGDVPGVEPCLVRGLGDPQLVLEDLARRRVGPLDPVENAEFQRAFREYVVGHGLLLAY